MDEFRAIESLSALANETRLAAFRLLLREAPDELAAGDIASRLGIVQNTMSSHLAVLARTGLISARKDGRNMLYRAEPAAMRALLAWLMEDCCQGDSEICAPLLDLVSCKSC
jgi:DNA-binding transcriptional ArsR family regulator